MRGGLGKGRWLFWEGQQGCLAEAPGAAEVGREPGPAAPAGREGPAVLPCGAGMQDAAAPRPQPRALPGGAGGLEWSRHGAGQDGRSSGCSARGGQLGSVGVGGPRQAGPSGGSRDQSSRESQAGQGVGRTRRDQGQLQVRLPRALSHCVTKHLRPVLLSHHCPATSSATFPVSPTV